MLGNNHGQVVMMCSVAGHMGESLGCDYHASKFAVRGLMESMGCELYDSKSAVKFTTIFPFFTKTSLIKNCDIKSRFMPVLEPEQTAEGVVDAILKEKIDAFIPSSMRIPCQVLKPFLPYRAAIIVRNWFGIKYK